MTLEPSNSAAYRQFLMKFISLSSFWFPFQSLSTSRINISIWETAHLPLPKPNINLNLLSIDCCWIRGGVGGQLPKYWYWSNISNISLAHDRQKKVIVVVYYSSQSDNGPLQGSSSLDIKNSSSWDELF